MTISDEERALFRQAVGRVKRVENDRVVHPKKRPRVRVRRALPDENPFHDLMSDDASWIEEHEEMRFARNGVQRKLLKALIQGEIYPEAVIDLHGLSAEEARDEVSQFLYYAIKQNLYCVKIIHGQGYHSEEGAIIRGLVNRWLRLRPEIIAFANPPQFMGGRGATLTILRSANPFKKYD